jgi:hypothetical protein
MDSCLSQAFCISGWLPNDSQTTSMKTRRILYLQFMEHCSSRHVKQRHQQPITLSTRDNLQVIFVASRLPSSRKAEDIYAESVRLRQRIYRHYLMDRITGGQRGKVTLMTMTTTTAYDLRR